MGYKINQVCYYLLVIQELAHIMRDKAEEGRVRCAYESWLTGSICAELSELDEFFSDWYKKLSANQKEYQISTSEEDKELLEYIINNGDGSESNLYDILSVQADRYIDWFWRSDYLKIKINNYAKTNYSYWRKAILAKRYKNYDVLIFDLACETIRVLIKKIDPVILDWAKRDRQKITPQESYAIDKCMRDLVYACEDITIAKERVEQVFNALENERSSGILADREYYIDYMWA